MHRLLLALLLPLLASAVATAAEPARAASGAAHGKAAKAARAVPVRLVDINSASRDELKTLPGVGDAEAAKIIARRPYLTKTELVSKGVMQVGPFTSLRHQVVAMPAKKAAKTARPPAAKASQAAPRS